MRFFAVLLLCVALAHPFSFDIKEPTIANGQTTMITFKGEENTAYTKALVGTKEYTIFQNPLRDGEHYVLIPLDYYTKEGNKKIVVSFSKEGKEEKRELFIRVVDGNYPKEELHVDNAKVHLSKADSQRAAQEYKEAMAIYNRVTPQSLINSEFVVPLQTKITSAFGKARTYNQTLKSYHGGTDFRAPIGLPIKASNDGIVVLAKDRFYSGKTIILDHGHGVYSVYFHLSELHAKEGERVQKNGVIGLAGDTGRVTGPHLHFGMRVHGAQVDPLQCIALLNSHLIKETQ